MGGGRPFSHICKQSVKQLKNMTDLSYLLKRVEFNSYSSACNTTYLAVLKYINSVKSID